MTQNIIAMDFNGVNVLLDTNTKLINLTVPTGLSANRTAHNAEDGSNYQVPVGKKATIIYIENYDVNTAFTSYLGYSDDLDGNTNAVPLVTGDGAGTALTNTIFISAEVPASKYIGFIFVSGSSTALNFWIIEEDV